MGRRGYILAVSAPSGTGKTSLCDRLAQDFDFVVRSISMTTRARRDGEVDGKDYQFVSREDFKRFEQEGALIETAEVFGNWYGTPRKPVDEAILGGKVIVMDIDTVGAFKLKKMLGEDCVMVFIKPPSLEELERRLKSRGKNTPQELQKRLSEAEREISESKDYEYVFTNEDFAKAYEQLKQIVQAEAAKPFRNRSG